VTGLRAEGGFETRPYETGLRAEGGFETRPYVGRPAMRRIWISDSSSATHWR